MVHQAFWIFWVQRCSKHHVDQCLFIFQVPNIYPKSLGQSALLLQSFKHSANAAEALGWGPCQRKKVPPPPKHSPSPCTHLWDHRSRVQRLINAEAAIRQVSSDLARIRGSIRWWKKGCWEAQQTHFDAGCSAPVNFLQQGSWVQKDHVSSIQNPSIIPLYWLVYWDSPSRLS